MIKINGKKTIVILLIILTSLSFFVLVKNVLFITGTMPTSAMEKTILQYQNIYGYRAAYVFSEPKRGDIVFYSSEEFRGYKILRVIGIPGDIIDLNDGKLYLNNSLSPLDEGYIKEPMSASENGHFVCPQNSYFLLGDNRNIALDSRNFDSPYIEKNNIIAKLLK